MSPAFLHSATVKSANAGEDGSGWFWSVKRKGTRTTSPTL
jgi:hypothetical protein